MSEAVEKGCDAGGVGKDGVPVGKGTVGGDEDRAAFVAAVNDFEEEVGGRGVVGEVADLVNAEEIWARVVGEFGAAQSWRIALEIGDKLGGGAKENGVAGLDGGVSDVFGDHGLAKAIGSEQYQVAGLRDEVESHGAFDQWAVDFSGPVPVEEGCGV